MGNSPIGGLRDSTLPEPARRAGLPLVVVAAKAPRVYCSIASCMAIWMCSPWPVRVRRYSAARMEMAVSMPVPVSPIVGPGFSGGPSGSPVMLIVPPQACAIMSKARFFSYGLPSPNPFTWA